MSYSTEVLTDSPLAWWRLSEASGTLTDSSGNSKTLTPVGGPTIGVVGPFSGESAVALDGSSQRLDSNIGMNHSDFTIEVWYKGTDGSGVIASARSGTGSSRPLLCGIGTVPVGSSLAGAPFMGVTGSGIWWGSRATSVLVNDGNWHHIAFVWDGTSGVTVTNSQFKIYVDGVSVALTDVNYSSVPAPLTSADGTFKFGYNPDDTAAGYLSGSLSNIALYGTPLSGSRVSAHYDAALGITTATTGALATTLPVPTVALSGTYAAPAVAGSLDATLPVPTTEFAGTYAAPPVGALAATLPVPTVTLAGTYMAPASPTGSFDLTLPVPTVSLSGTYVVDAPAEIVRNGFGLVLDSSATVGVVPPLDSSSLTSTVPLHIIAATVPVPTLVAGRPS